MTKPISTKVHGIIDYMTAGLLVALPRALGMSRTVTCLLDASAAGTVAYSLFTRYELGAVKALPMKAHLALDAVQGGALIGAAAFLEDEDAETRATLAALGVFELGVTLLSQTRSPQDMLTEGGNGEPGARSRPQSSSASMPQAGYARVGSEPMREMAAL